MKLHYQDELKSISERIDEALNVALQERKDLGLPVPESFDTEISFYKYPKAEAVARFVDNKPMIAVNAGTVMFHTMKPEQQAELREVMDYFDIVRDLVNSCEEDPIFSIIDNPQDGIKKIEDSFASGEALETYKTGFKERGNSYDYYTGIATRHADYIKGAIGRLMPVIMDAFNENNLYVLRHELDHADFYNSDIYSVFLKQIKETDELSVRLHVGKDESVSKEYAQANMDTLQMSSKMKPLLETRALFFTHIEPEGWDKADYDVVRKKVFGEFCESYIEGHFPEDMTDKIVSLAWSNGTMDRQTSNYIFKRVNTQRKSTNAMRYSFQHELVNFDVANDIIYRQLPDWKLRFANSADFTSRIFANAYQNDPSRIADAKPAKNFQEYLELLG